MNSEVLQRAIDTYGREHQILKTVEELAELQKAILDLVLRRDGVRPIVGEIADVLIMLKQLEMIFHIEDGINREIEYKTQRLRRRMDELSKES